MVITILAEPRTGSTNLADWFNFNNDFTVLQVSFKINIPNKELKN